MEKEQHVVGFRIGRETFGVPISMVREIVRVPTITAVPNAPDYVEGVINLRGKIVSVIDLRKRFGERDVQPSKKNRILVVDMADRVVGLIVNSASEVLKIPPADIEPPQAVFPEGDMSYVTGVGKLKDRLIIILDLVKVLENGGLGRLEEFADPVATKG